MNIVGLTAEAPAKISTQMHPTFKIRLIIGYEFMFLNIVGND